MKILPHKYQVKAVEHCLKYLVAALFLDLGLGKTVIVLTAIYNLLKGKQIKGALVLAPLRVCHNVWPQEIAKWDHLKHLSCGILHGPKKGDVLQEAHDVYVLNYEGLPWLIDQLADMPPSQWPFDMIVFDESTAIKNHQTKRFKMLKKIIDRFKRRIILTGTPAPNSLLDVWAQYYMLDDGDRLGSSHYWFRDSYFYQSDYLGYKWAPLPDSSTEISNKVRDITMRLKAEDYLDMPKLFTGQTLWKMSPKHCSKYQELERDFLAEIEGEVVTAVNAAALSTKLRQYVSGFVYQEDRQVLDVHNEKLDVLSEIVEGNPSENMLVSIQFRHEYKLIKKRFKNAPVIYGGMSQSTTQSLIEKWNRGDIKILVVHPASIAHGVNLQQGGRMLIWFGIPWSYEHYSQMVGRLHRQGQDRPVINTFLVAKNTVEEDVVAALENKAESEAAFAEKLIESLRGRR